MSNGLFQSLPGAHEMGGAHAIPSEPWLLPISDTVRAESTPEALLLSVRQSARPFQIAANALLAVLVLALTAQITIDWTGSRTAASQRAMTGHVADATLTINN